MKSLFLTFLAVLPALCFSQSIEELLEEGEIKFEQVNDTIFKQKRGYADDPFNALLFDREDHDGFIDWFFRLFGNKDNYNRQRQVLTDNYEDTPPRVAPRTKTEYFDIPIELASGEKVTINFGRSNDGVSAYQKVDTLLINAMRDVLERTNSVLSNKKVPPITSLYVHCTTNGHDAYPNSNHLKKQAIDISEINGNRVINTRISKKIMDEFGDEVARLDFEKEILGKYKLVFRDAVAVQIDELYLYDRVRVLQAVMMKHPRVRENFGPFLMKKYLRKNKRTIDKTGDVRPHEDHIHFSVR